MLNKKYRPNVGVFVVNNKGEILTCEREDFRGTWQIPQGGIEKGERVADAAIRELYEEIGTKAANYVGTLPGKYRYDWPKQLRKRGYWGQEQVFLIFKISPWAKIDLKRASKKEKGVEQEFHSYEFLTPKAFLARVNGFKRATYKKALKEALTRFPELFMGANV